MGRLPLRAKEVTTMPQSKNMSRLSEDMKRELISVIGGMKDPRLQGGLLSVMRVEVAPDLSSAKVYISMMGREDGSKEAAAALNRAAGPCAQRNCKAHAYSKNTGVSVYCR